MPRRRDPSQARTRRVIVCFSSDEVKALRELAKEARTTLARLIYVRSWVRRPPPAPENLEVAKELSRLGVNLNQIAHRVNADPGDADAKALREEIAEVVERISALKAHFLGVE